MFGIAIATGAAVAPAMTLAASMLGLQFCIGAVNDLFDEELDAASKRFKPIPARLVSRPTAWIVGVAAGVGGLVLAAFARGFDPLMLTMASAMLGAGLVYDAWLKPTPLGWVCFVVAFPILPVFAWYGATGALPPRVEILLPVAALSGPALHLANGLVDYEADAAGGVRNMPIVLGRRLAIVVMAVLMLVIHVLAWATIGGSAPETARFAFVAAGLLATGGVGLSSSRGRSLREAGWSLQAGSIALLGLGWLVAAAAAG